MQSICSQRISHIAPTIELALLKRIDQCQSNIKTHSNPHSNMDRA